MSHSEFLQVPPYTNIFLKTGSKQPPVCTQGRSSHVHITWESADTIVPVSKLGKLALFRIASKFTKLRSITSQKRRASNTYKQLAR